MQPQSLAELLEGYESLVQMGENLVALKRCLKKHNISPPVIKPMYRIRRQGRPFLDSTVKNSCHPSQFHSVGDDQVATLHLKMQNPLLVAIDHNPLSKHYDSYIATEQWNNIYLNLASLCTCGISI